MVFLSNNDTDSRQNKFLPDFCICILLLSLVFFMSDLTAGADLSGTVPDKSWRELGKGQSLQPVNGAFYYEFVLPNGSNAHLVVAYLKGGKWRVRPFISEKTACTSRICLEQSASAAINGGFFNLSDGMSASYVTCDGKLLADPHENPALMDNPRLQRFLPQILDRSEIRVLKSQLSAKCYRIEIARHDEPLPSGQRLVDALQAGPRLLPVLESENEAFLRKQSDGSFADSIGCKKAAARSAFGITADGYALLLAVSDRAHDGESSGITLLELANLMRRLGCCQAINLDGGSSTSMYVRLSNRKNQEPGLSVCAKSPETLVKTVLLLLPQ